MRIYLKYLKNNEQIAFFRPHMAKSSIDKNLSRFGGIRLRRI